MVLGTLWLWRFRGGTCATVPTIKFIWPRPLCCVLESSFHSWVVWNCSEDASYAFIGNSLLFNGHVDVVPVTGAEHRWTSPPFHPENVVTSFLFKKKKKIDDFSVCSTSLLALVKLFMFACLLSSALCSKLSLIPLERWLAVWSRCWWHERWNCLLLLCFEGISWPLDHAPSVFLVGIPLWWSECRLVFALSSFHPDASCLLTALSGVRAPWVCSNSQHSPSNSGGRGMHGKWCTGGNDTRRVCARVL